jgi:hypothetical protein
MLKAAASVAAASLYCEIATPLNPRVKPEGCALADTGRTLGPVKSADSVLVSVLAPGWAYNSAFHRPDCMARGRAETAQPTRKSAKIVVGMQHPPTTFRRTAHNA